MKKKLTFIILIAMSFAGMAQSESEPNNTLFTANQIDIGTEYVASISPSNDKDFFKFYLPASGALSITVSNVPSNLDLDFVFYNFLGHPIWSQMFADGEGIIHERVICRKGMYFLQLTDDENSNSMYKIKIELDTINSQSICTEEEGEWNGRYWDGNNSFSNYQPTSLFINNGLLQLPAGSSPTSFFFSDFSIKTDLCVGDSFTYETKWQNNINTGGIDAFDLAASIIGENGVLHINLFDDTNDGFGNVQYTSYSVGGQIYWGFNQFIQNLTDWSTLKIESNSSGVSFYHNNTLLINHPTEGDFGKIIGLDFWLKGSAPVDYVKIWDSENELIYNENFDDVNFEPSIPCLPNSTDDLNKNLQEIVSLYPNPTSEIFQLKVPDNLVGKDVEIQIVNCSGEIIFRQKKAVLGNTEIMIDKIPSGFYFVNIIGENWNVVKKMIKIE